MVRAATSRLVFFSVAIGPRKNCNCQQLILGLRIFSSSKEIRIAAEIRLPTRMRVPDLQFSHAFTLTQN